MKTVHANEWWVKELEHLMAAHPGLVSADQCRALGIALKIVRDGMRFNYDTEEWVDNAAKDDRALRLENALRAMLVPFDDAPEHFPDQNAAYLTTVAIPRAQKALSGEPE